MPGEDSIFAKFVDVWRRLGLEKLALAKLVQNVAQGTVDFGDLGHAFKIAIYLWSFG